MFLFLDLPINMFNANWRVLSCLLEKEEEEDEDIDMGGMFGDDDY